LWFDAAVPFEPVRLAAVGAHGSVPALAFVPHDTTPSSPLLLFGHGANLSKDDPIMQQIAKTLARWVPALVALIDFPAHGERADSTTSPDVVAAAVEASMADDTLPAQLADDWNAVIAAARAQTRGRVGYVGFSMGAVHGFTSVGLVAEVEAAAFIVGGLFLAGYPDADTSAKRNAMIRRGLPALGEREVLMCNMTRDEHFPIDLALEAFELVPGPKRMHVYEGTHWDVGPEAVRSAADFFRRTLAASD
jgi:dienelactone hydrolase